MENDPLQVVNCLPRPHFHTDEKGLLVECYHKCKNNWVGFLVGITVSFPLEHLLWEKVWPFNLVTKWLGL